TAQGSFLGIDGYTLNMKHQAENEEDPSLIWQYEQDGDNSYLKNVYAGMYPQNIPGGQAATAKIGTGKEKKFTYALFADATETEAAKWNIFFGGTQVNCEGSNGNKGNVNYWYGDNAHYYITEVNATDEELSKLCATYYSANPKADEDVSGVEPIDIAADAQAIISPTEFGSPRDINNVINTYKDKLNLAAADATQAKVQDMYAALANWAIVRTYQNAVDSYGSLLSVAYTTSNAEYGTIILPINFATPAGWTRYTCSAAPGGKLQLTENTDGVNKNKPFIVRFSEEERGKKYQIIGYANGAATTNQTAGLLTGVLNTTEVTKVPAGSYILANRNGQIGFYRVAEGADFTATVNKCYLTLPAESAARFEALFFDGTATAIEGVQDTQAKQNSGIYNMAGQRLSKLQKGLNIVNGKVVLVK
ncbi:MAG: hypothetical protein K2G61_05005, partial [Bacteroidaceae bacterium]|nr:hypothetical protein [Bacteroidaceae bacterium]